MPACAECGEDNPVRARFCLRCGARLAAPEASGATRRTVTVLFCDIVDSTPLGERLDAETYRRVQSRYFEDVRAALERHGGTVEKYIGDAVMAVFGIPTLHEDDALRAVRAAAELRQAVASLDEELARDHGLRLRLRVGVATGEVVAGDPADGQSFATGDTVVVAERLQRAAQPSEALIADSTYRLVVDAAVVEPVDPVPAKGKVEPVEAWRLVGVETDAPPFARRLDTPLVGREFEYEQLRGVFDEVLEQRVPRLVTVLGPAGIGKSRLVAELCASVGDRATTAKGRCLPYGDGITFWPLKLVVHALGGPAAVKDALAADDDADAIAARVLGAIGELPTSGQDTFWAFRRFFEALARRSPLVLLLEDLHWGEPTFLDLVEYLVDWCRDAPILIICTARAELLERRPRWLNPRAGSLAVTLEPLSNAHADELLEVLRGETDVRPETRRQIAAAAEGNPLFVEQMVAMAAETGGVITSVPPSLQALLAARLDRLPEHERALLERASAIGREFSRAAVAHLSPPAARAGVGASLLSLVRKELIRPADGSPRDEAYRFSHILIRDAAYERVPKAARADLHERLAAWLTEDSRADDAIAGFHLEQAYRYRETLGIVDEHARELARRGAERLGAAGRAAIMRGDAPAAVSFLARTTTLLETDDPARSPFLVDLANALMSRGELAQAQAALDEARRTAGRLGDRRTELRAIVDDRWLRVFRGGEPVGEAPDLVGAIIPELEELGDDLGLARAWRVASEAHAAACRWSARAEALERALAHARRTDGNRHEANAVRAMLAQALHFGPTPASEALARCRTLLGEAGDDIALHAGVKATLGAVLATQGAFPEARAAYGESARLHDELGLQVRRAAGVLFGAEIEMLAGDPAAAEEELRHGYAILEGIGETGVRSVVAAALADVLCAQGRDDDAAAIAEIAAEIADPDDVAAQALQLATRARILARGGDVVEAEALASAAGALADRTDFVALQAAALIARAEVREASGRNSDALALVSRARELHKAKGNVIAAARLSEQLAAYAQRA